MQHLDQQLDAFCQELLRMGAKAKAAVEKAVRAAEERDDALADQVKREDDVLDGLEMQLDDQALHLLSKAPMATQLRLIIAALKICQHLERIGDEATTIARRAIELSQEPQLKDVVDLPRLSRMAVTMLDEALEAFVSRNVQQATELIGRDKEVDALNDQIHQALTERMIGDPQAISRCLHLRVISKSLERIADHAANIAEETAYLTLGRDVRHPRAANQASQEPRA